MPSASRWSGMGCQASAPPVMQARKAGKIARRFTLSIGLLCSKTFDDAIFPELFEAQVRPGPGRHRQDEHQGRLPGLDARRQLPRDPAEGGARLDPRGLHSCPDFAAEHADISTGGIGAFGDWTLTLLRTEKGEELFDDMEAAGVIETRPIEDDPGAVTLLNKLSRVSRKRWPATAVPMPGRLPAATPRLEHRPMSGPEPDAFAALLGIEVERRGPGHTVATPDHGRTPRQPARHGARRGLLRGGRRRGGRRGQRRRALGHHLVGPGRVPPAGRHRRRALRRGHAGRSRPTARTSSPGRSAAARAATSWPGCAPAAPRTGRLTAAGLASEQSTGHVARTARFRRSRLA